MTPRTQPETAVLPDPPATTKGLHQDPWLCGPVPEPGTLDGRVGSPRLDHPPKMAFETAVATLKGVLQRVHNGDPAVAEIAEVVAARAEVLPRYQALFDRTRVEHIDEDDFREFLHFKNNRHWQALQRMGPAVTQDMPRLRKALGILLDEERPVRERLNELVPATGPAFVPRLSKAILTPILLISNPQRYGVWNQVVEAGLRTVDLWPDFDRSAPFGDRYDAINSTLVRLAEAVGVDLWVLDALWWKLEEQASAEHDGDVPVFVGAPAGEGAARFYLERHLQEFMRDNWDRIELGREWRLHEEDDEQVGFEYRVDVGAIDLLARHKRDGRWLVIELKRAQTTDQTIGQVMRYMGWVKQRMAQDGEAVEGLIIARGVDDGLMYAASLMPSIRVQTYEVNFRLLAVEGVKQG